MEIHRRADLGAEVGFVDGSLVIIPAEFGPKIITEAVADTHNTSLGRRAQRRAGPPVRRRMALPKVERGGKGGSAPQRRILDAGSTKVNRKP